MKTVVQCFWLLLAPHCLAEVPGTVRWVSLIGWSYGSPAIGPDHTIYAGSADGNLYALTPQGSNAWHFQAGGAIHSSPAVADHGTVYFGCDDGKLYAVNPEGTLRWTWGPAPVPFASSPIRSSPAIGWDGTIYIGAGGGLHAVNPDGTTRWRFVLDELNYTDSTASPAIGNDGTLYMLAGKLFALRPDGSKQWEFADGHDPMVSLYLNQNDSVAIASEGTLVFSGSAASLYAVDSQGRERWHTNGLFEFGGFCGLYKTPAIARNGTIHAMASYRNGANIVFAFAPDGAQKWYAGGSGRYSDGNSPAVDEQGNACFAASGWYSYHEYYALNSNGSTQWTLPYFGNLLGGPVTIGQDGTLYVWASSAQGSGLYAFAGTNAAPHTSWPMHRQNARQTGKVEWPRLHGLTFAPDRVQVEVVADPGWKCIVQVSSDLQSWDTLTNFVAFTNRNFVSEAVVSEPAQRFYRVLGE